ncbi:MAG: flagellar hook-basal body complex protein [Solirubrobacterales bacterium]
MLPSMYSAISGLRANQKKLDVIGNNIANVSTTAFKVQTVRFQDMLSQTVGEAVGAGSTTGGINPKQVGLGVKIGAINTLNTTGNMQSTGNTLDAAIDGKGYFMVGKGVLPPTNADGVTVNNTAADHTLGTSTSPMDVMYTRDGSFTLDSEGNLLTSNGYRVLGFALSSDGGTTNSINYDTAATPPVVMNYVDADSTTLKAGTTLVPLRITDSVLSGATTKMIKSFTIEKGGLIKAVLEDGSVTALGQIAMAGFSNESGLSKVGGNLYKNTANSGAVIVRSGVGTAAADDNSNSYGDMLQSVLEMSNVDLAEQFTDMIVASRAFQANGKMITTGDELLETLVNLKR